jgi:hypothetical protein
MIDTMLRDEMQLLHAGVLGSIVSLFSSSDSDDYGIMTHIHKALKEPTN